MGIKVSLRLSPTLIPYLVQNTPVIGKHIWPVTCIHTLVPNTNSPICILCIQYFEISLLYSLPYGRERPGLMTSLKERSKSDQFRE